MSNVLIVGLGYVGLPIAIRAAEAGHIVIGVDVSEDKIDALHNEHSYVEDVSDEQIAKLQRSGRLKAVTRPRYSEFVAEHAVRHRTDHRPDARR